MVHLCFKHVSTESGSFTHILRCNVCVPTRVFVMTCKRGGVGFIEGLFGSHKSYRRGAWKSPEDICKFKEKLERFVDGFDWASLAGTTEPPPGKK